MAVISQSSFLFNEVLRRSLDPADKFIVEELRNILDKVKLKSTVVIEMVNFTVTWQKMVLISVSESGSWSASLALFCLDQATSSVDTQRDELIQSIIRNKRWIIVLFWRLSTVSDYDRIMVLGEGKIVGTDSPKTLLKNKLTFFY